MKLDLAGPTDAPAMAAAHALSFDTPWNAADIATLLASPGVFGLIVRHGAEVAGFALGRAVAGEAELLTLAVAPSRRRQGLGAALVEAVAARAVAAGAMRLFLEVAADNAAALALYEGAGFAPVGRREAYYRRADGAAHALVLARDLNRPAA